MTAPIPSPSDLRGLAELEARATKGPWVNDPYPTLIETKHAENLADCCMNVHVTADSAEYRGYVANAALIVAMRNALPGLLARIAELEEALQQIANFPREKLVMLGPGFGGGTMMNIARAALSPEKP